MVLSLLLLLLLLLVVPEGEGGAPREGVLHRGGESPRQHHSLFLAFAGCRKGVEGAAICK